MQGNYLVANVTSYDIPLFALNIIIPAKKVVNLFELAPELTLQWVLKEEQGGILGLRIKQGMLIKVVEKENNTLQKIYIPQQINNSSCEQINPIKEAVGTKKKASVKSQQKIVEKRNQNSLHKLNDEKVEVNRNRDGMITYNPLSDIEE